MCYNCNDLKTTFLNYNISIMLTINIFNDYNMSVANDIQCVGIALGIQCNYCYETLCLFEETPLCKDTHLQR
jgi:hypothetical protein